MSDLVVTSASGTPAAGTHARTTEKPEGSAPAEKSAVSDRVELSKAVPIPTKVSGSSELRAQILGYGSVSLKQGAAAAVRPDGGSMTRFTTHCDWTYIDLVNGTINRVTSSSAWTLAKDGTGGSVSSLDTCVTFRAASYRPGQLGSTIDRLTASHAARRQFLESSCSGQALNDGLSRLEDLYRQGREEAVSSFADMLSSFLDKTGQAGGRAKVAGSVRALFVQCEVKYQSIAAKQNRKDWSSASLYEMTARMQAVGASVRTEQTKDGHYSLKELEFAAMSISAYQAAVNTAWQGGGSEGRYALSVSMVSMKVEVMSARRLIGGDLAHMLRQSGRNAQEAVLSAMDDCLTRRREEGGDRAAYPAAERALFDGVFANVMDSFRMTGDGCAAIREGASAAKRLLSAAIDRTPARRWTDEMAEKGYWSTFENASYQGGVHRFEADWQDFLSRIAPRQGSLHVQA